MQNVRREKNANSILVKIFQVSSAIKRTKYNRVKNGRNRGSKAGKKVK
jgi:hypothetical protein